ncbi:EscN/YscN/HrcN family type III secretion system ATPase [Cupriavidus gilardii]|uniref:EscN/YscN/HrcN family type III secretion system ATPase n=1 Tax=Cupriavidus gilardii TaxID=82541 RepID=UPI001EE5C4BB|nr:EscN/YscN/HrcN family type III secretion system ATPase [Cupriavidus gilardii]MCG5258911.1 EscN/YscN/HrcN family type III secretion system ATPase [Cupriavidus gilardii]
MRMPDVDAIVAGVSGRLTLPALDDGVERFGRVVEVGPTLIKASLPDAALAELCLIGGDMQAEVVGLQREIALLSPFSEPIGMSCGALVRPLGTEHRIPVGPHLIGSVVDGLGRLMSGPPVPAGCETRALEAAVPDPLTRTLIDQVLPLGVRAIDGMLTCGRGQRIGIFAAAGGGKSTLLGMICDGSLADVVVLGLVGERGREVREFLDQTLTAEARARSVVVVSTSDRPALERLKAVYTATTIAEYFRDQGLNVLLMVDSLTRFARAGREIGLAAGELPAAGSFPPSVFARLPRLLERAGCAASGSITGIYTVLVEGDDMTEPIADEVRSILDGHIVLSRELAEKNHYPAIDIPASISRVMHQVTSEQHRQWAGRARRLLAQYKEIELLVRVGEYERGHDAEADDALDRRGALEAFLCQSTGERADYQGTLRQLRQVVEG